MARDSTPENDEKAQFHGGERDAQQTSALSYYYTVTHYYCTGRTSSEAYAQSQEGAHAPQEATKQQQLG